MAFRCEGKSSWPELVGANGEAAAATIESQNHKVNAINVPEGSSVTLDFRKNMWPELTGLKGEVAVATIERENPTIKAHVVQMKVGTFITDDYRGNRVRVFVNEEGKVTQVPQIG